MTAAHDKLDQFVDADLIQHAPQIAAGKEGLVSWLNSEQFGRYEMLFKIIGQNDFVMTYGKRHALGKDIAVFDLYRLAKGKIVEHWECAEEISPREMWGNSGKF